MMRVDNFLNTYNMGTNALLERAARNPNAQKAGENFGAAFGVKNAEDEALKEQTDAFEAFLVKSVLDLSLKNQNSLFGKDASDEIYSSMYNDTMSKALSGGLGFSKMLFDFLKERG